eukprot:SAG31_NODE_327_length_17650_cov_18.626574_6_plen_347_part_00
MVDRAQSSPVPRSRNNSVAADRQSPDSRRRVKSTRKNTENKDALEVAHHNRRNSDASSFAAEAAAAVHQAAAAVVANIVECDSALCTEAERRAAGAPYHWLQLATKSTDPILIEIVLEAIASAKIKRSDLSHLENRLKELLANLHQEAPPALSNDETIQDMLCRLGVSGNLLRQCWSVVHEADLRSWSTKFTKGTVDEQKSTRARRWDEMRVLFVDVYGDHKNRAQTATTILKEYTETYSILEVQALVSTSQLYDLRTISPEIDAVVKQLGRLADHCDHTDEIDAVMKSTDVNIINDTLAHFIEMAIADEDILCKKRSASRSIDVALKSALHVLQLSRRMIDSMSS